MAIPFNDANDAIHPPDEGLLSSITNITWRVVYPSQRAVPEDVRRAVAETVEQELMEHYRVLEGLQSGHTFAPQGSPTSAPLPQITRDVLSQRLQKLESSPRECNCPSCGYGLLMWSEMNRCWLPCELCEYEQSGF